MGCWCSKKNVKSTSLNTAPQRRLCLSHHPLIQQRQSLPNIEIISEYVATLGGHIIFCKCFRSALHMNIPIKGMICFCSGYGGYTDWTNTDFAQNFVNRGYIFIVYDHWGHGRSDGIWMSTKDGSFHTWMDDAIFIFERAKRKYTPSDMRSTMKYFMLGNSLGGAVAIQVSRKYTDCHWIEDEEHSNDSLVDEYLPSIFADMDNHQKSSSNYGWNGMILIAPMVKLVDELKPNYISLKLLDILQPIFPHWRIIPGKKYVITRDDQYLEMISKSPLLYEEQPTLSFGMSVLRICSDIEQNMHNIRLPFYLLHGSDDEIIDPQMSYLLADKCGCVNEMKFKVYDHGFHSLLLDIDRDQVFDDICQWMDEH